MLTLLAYIYYASVYLGFRAYLVCGIPGFGLRDSCPKPMLVTLPFVLLLLDYWPLG